MEYILSVIIPVYGVEKYIGRCLEILLRQEKINFREGKIEIILIDDGSIDNSPQICDKYASNNKIIKVIHKENGGVASARNAGLDIAKGKWVTFIDPDDTVTNDYFFYVLKLIEEYSEADCILFGMSIKNVGNKTSVYYDNPIFYGKIIDWIRIVEKKGLLNYPWNKIYKKRIIDEYSQIRFTEGKEPGEDLIFNCEYLRRVSKGAMSERHLYEYHKQCDVEGSLSHKYWPDLNEKTKIFIKARCNMYNTIGMCSSEDKMELAKQSIYYIYKCIPNMYKNGKHFEQRKRLEFYKEIIKDKQVKKWMKIDPNKEMVIRIFKLVYRTRSALLCDTVYSFLFWIKNKKSDKFDR